MVRAHEEADEKYDEGGKRIHRKRISLRGLPAVDGRI